MRSSVVRWRPRGHKYERKFVSAPAPPNNHSHPNLMPRLIRYSLLLGLVLLSVSATAPAFAMRLVIVGGGKLNDTIYRELLSLSPAENPRVLVIPHASRPPDRAKAGQRSAETFQRLGVRQIEVLDLSNPRAARQAIERAEVIWMSGGLQTLLMAALGEAGVLDTLRARVMAGVPIGGTSAGAAVMSRQMIAGTDRSDPASEMKPRFARGLGFWPEAIVDQHFSQRRRLPRLTAAVREHPQHVGIGIDEDTAVVYDGRIFYVVGEHTVTVLRAAGQDASSPLQSMVLRGGDSFNFAALMNAATSPGVAPAAPAAAAADPVAQLCDRVVPELMRKARVPGVAVALVRRHELVWLGHYGVKTAGRDEAVDRDTIFEAASMSKPVFAYAVLQLVQEGLLDLDRPLVQYLGAPYPNADPRHDRITARMVLTHTAGFPNWRPGGRRGGGPLPIHFEPGTEQRYSGEGFQFLQRAVEKLTGTALPDLMQRRLFAPLGLQVSSYVWRDEFAAAAAAGHTRDGKLPAEARPFYRDGNAAFTLYTTPAEYARFIIEMMRPERSATHSLNQATLNAMLTAHPIIGVRPEQSDGEEGGGTIRFGLGWRVDDSPAGLRVHHSGSNRTGFRCYTEFYPETGDGIVIMTNASSGNKVWSELVRQLHERRWPKTSS